MNKLLIFIPSPRDIPEFQEVIDQIPHDKLFIKYLHYRDEPYNKARKFFLNHNQYTHFAICPDDLIVTPDGVEQLWKDAQTMKFIAGMCNVDMEDMNKIAATIPAPSVVREGRKFNWLRIPDIIDKKNPILKVGWCGTPFAIMPRQVIEGLNFTGDIKWNPFGDKTESFDIQTAHDLAEMGIEEYIDTRVFFTHRRFGGEIFVGRKHPYYLWVHDGKKTKTMIKNTGIINPAPEYQWEKPPLETNTVCSKCGKKVIKEDAVRWTHENTNQNTRCGTNPVPVEVKE